MVAYSTFLLFFFHIVDIIIIRKKKKRTCSFEEHHLFKKRNRFADLFRHSKLVQLGDFEGRIVIGEIVRRVADDLYIDFGLKFQAVCKVPPVGGE